MQVGFIERRPGLLAIHEGKGKEGRRQRATHLSENEL